MARRILLGCYEVPGWGGAATVHYQLFERLRRDGWDVAYVNLVSEHEAPLLRRIFGPDVGNPRALANVATCVLPAPLWQSHRPVTDLIEAFAPDVLLGFGFIGALLLKQSAPRRPLIFMTSGSRSLKHLVAIGAVRDVMGFERAVRRGVDFVPARHRLERQITEASDCIVVHSPLVRFAFEHFFPGSVAKTYARDISVADLVGFDAAPYRHLAQPFETRDIDVLFVASMWKRPEKNFALVKHIAARCRGMRIHVVGQLPGRPEAHAQYHGVVPQRADLFALLARTKVLACPSALDPAPGVLFEASEMGCNVVASRNCGNWRLCHDALLADRCGPADFVAAIRRGVQHRYPDQRALFRGGYEDLLSVLRVF